MNYLAHKIQPLPRRTKPGRTETHSATGKPHFDERGEIKYWRLPPNVIRQKDVAQKYNVARIAVRRAAANGKLDTVTDDRGVYYIHDNQRLKNWVKRYKENRYLGGHAKRGTQRAKQYDAENKFIEECYFNSMTVKGISKIIGKRPQTVSSRLKALGINIRWSTEGAKLIQREKLARWRRIAKLYDAGVALEKITEECECSVSTVYRALDRHGKRRRYNIGAEA